MADRLRIVIAEDNYLVREGTRRLLEDSGEVEVLAGVGNGGELLAAVGQLRPDAVLTDIRMPPGHQTEGIEACVTGGAHRVSAMLCEHLAQGQIGLRLVVRQFGHNGRWRWDNLAEHAMHHPESTLHRAGPQAGRVLCKENRHGQKTAALVYIGIVYAHPGSLIIQRV